jgi:hypothetical protein
VASAALVAAGKGNVAALVASSMTPLATAADVGSPTVDTSNEMTLGIASANGIAASDSSSPFSDLIYNGLASGAAFAAASLLAIYLYVRRAALPATPNPKIARAAAEMINPLYTKHAKHRRSAGKK